MDKFDAVLRENGAELPVCLVRALLTVIHAILPATPKTENGSMKQSGFGREKAKLCEGRANPDKQGIDRLSDRNRDNPDKQGIGRPSGRNRDRDRDRRDRHRDRCDADDRDRKRRGRHMYHSDEPELYSVYKGRVCRVMGTGCFVQLNDFRGKEGLVQVSQIASRRVGHAKDVVQRVRWFMSRRFLFQVRS